LIIGYKGFSWTKGDAYEQDMPIGRQKGDHGEANLSLGWLEDVVGDELILETIEEFRVNRLIGYNKAGQALIAYAAVVTAERRAI